MFFYLGIVNYQGGDQLLYIVEAYNGVRNIGVLFIIRN